MQGEGVPAVLLGHLLDVDEWLVEAVRLAAALEDEDEGVHERPMLLSAGFVCGRGGR